MAGVSTAHLKRCLGTYTSGVAVITTTDAETDQWYGITINSLASVSLDPPIVLWSLRAESRLVNVFEGGDRFIANILSEKQKDLANIFASPDFELRQFGWERSEVSNIPILPSCLCHLECVIVDRQRVGDHIIYFGRIDTANLGEESLPLLYGRRYMRALPV